MKSFVRLSRSLQRIGERRGTANQLFKFVPILLSIPCFKAGEFFFKFGYAINRRRIARLGGEDLFSQISDGRISFNSIVSILQRLREIEHGLESTQTGKNFGYHDIRS
jgi:hypothetical protein